MKKLETFAQWAADQHSHQKRMISAIRKLVKKTSPNGAWLGQEWPVAFLHAKDIDAPAFARLIREAAQHERE